MLCTPIHHRLVFQFLPLSQVATNSTNAIKITAKVCSSANTTNRWMPPFILVVVVAIVVVVVVSISLVAPAIAAAAAGVSPAMLLVGPQ